MSSVALLCALLLSVLVAVSGQDLTNVRGSATCNFTTMQATPDRTSAIVQMVGYLTVNLTAGAYTQPNTPGFAGQTYFSYPITSIGGYRWYYNTTVSRTAGVYSYITGIGQNRTLYMTFNPMLNQTGFDTDGSYIYRLDYTGISILTDSPTLPVVQFAEVNTLSSNQYSELDLYYTGQWGNASFQLSTCTFNYVIVTPVANTTNTTGTNSTRAATAVGDPAFTGFLGQRYQIHGMADTVYSVISDALVQLNAMFVFLNQGQCPVVDGRRLTNCWSHPGSYFGSLALKTAEGDRLLIQAGSYKNGFSLTLNDQPLTASVSRSGLRVTVVDSFRMVVEAGLYRLRIENSDQFVNIAAVEVLDWQKLKSEVQPHGLLGQTWSKQSRNAPIEGNVDDYAEADNALFGSQFLYSKFGK